MAPKRGTSKHGGQRTRSSSMALQSDSFKRRHVEQEASSRVVPRSTPVKKKGKWSKRCIFVDDEAQIEEGSNVIVDEGHESKSEDARDKDVVEEQTSENDTQKKTKHLRQMGNQVPLGIMNDVFKSILCETQVSNIWHNIEDNSNNSLSPSNRLGSNTPQGTKQPISPKANNQNTDARRPPPSPTGFHSENVGTAPLVMQEGAFIIEVADPILGQWFIRNTSLSVFKWYEGFNPRGDKPSRVPVWVDFLDLPVDFYQWLEQMGGQLGIVLGQKVEGGINPKWDPQLLIEIDLRNLPNACFNCMTQGHLIRNCPDLLPKEPEKDKMNKDANSFQQVQRKNAYRPPRRPRNLNQKVPTQQTMLKKVFDPFLYEQVNSLFPQGLKEHDNLDFLNEEDKPGFSNTKEAVEHPISPTENDKDNIPIDVLADSDDDNISDLYKPFEMEADISDFTIGAAI
ncbi:hypothetical protein L7F22_011658 [Adiantum nelumboides]|nr:hypothetical protein [Adiantum nelumboides]